MKRIMILIKVLIFCLFFSTCNLFAKPTLINLILDESGSMEEIKQETIDGFNEYVSTMKEKEDTYFIVTRFNGCSIKTIERAKKLTKESYRPNCNTPLYDAIMRNFSYISENDIIQTLTEKCKHCEQKIIPNKLCIILTDGRENASIKYVREEVAEEIKFRKIGDWKFVFLGTDKSNFETIKAINIYDSFLFNTKDVRGVFNGMIDCSNSFIETGVLNVETSFEGLEKK